MKNSMKIKVAISSIVISVMLVGCGAPTNAEQPVETQASERVVTTKAVETTVPQTTTVTEMTTMAETVKEVDYQVIQPNEIGSIMIVMYHGIMDNPPYHRTVENFKKDLQYMYDNGYRLISMDDFIHYNIEVEAGFTPIVLTFDDGLATTFSLELKDGVLVPKEDTAVGLIEAFCEEHPDFGKAAIFYLNGSKEATFRGEGTYEERLQWLIDNGYELGNHLYNHPNMKKFTGDQVQKEVGKVANQINEAIGVEINSVSYPFGIRPPEAFRKYIEKGSYEDIEYRNVLAVREAYREPLMPSIHVDYDPFNCSRVRGNEGEFGDLWWAFGVYENKPQARYISDGDPNTIVVRKENEDLVNKEVIGGKELITYSLKIENEQKN